MFYFLLFLLIPIIEIIVFIQVGQHIGILSTLLLCLATAAGGILLIKLQGLQTLRRAQSRLIRREAPLSEMFDGLCLFVAGLFLLTPGFVTDCFGGLLLLPPVRAYLRSKITEIPSVFVQSTHFAQGNPNDTDHASHHHDHPPTTIEGEYTDVTEKDAANDKNKG